MTCAGMTRRTLLAAATAIVTTPTLAAGLNKGPSNIDVSGSSPPLAFTLTRASDGKQVTGSDFHGKVVLLYFGYTFCPDVCPLTLTNIDAVLKGLGKQAEDVRVLFVTVDPVRDTLPVLKQYAAAFGPEVVGLRGTPDQLATLAQRYRIAYSVKRSGNDYQVTHSSAIYAFDGTGAARLLIPSFANTSPDITGATTDLRRLIDTGQPRGLFSHLLEVLEGLV